MKALSIVVSTSLFTYTCNFARNFFPVFKGIFVSLMLAMKFAGKKKQRIQVRFAMALSKSFQTVRNLWRRYLVHDRKYGGTGS